MATAHVSPFQTLATATAEAVGDGLNVVVSGHPGAGLEHVALDLSRELGSERRVLTVTGVKAWQQSPFSALSFLIRGETTAIDARLPGLAVAGGLRAAVEELARSAGATGVLLVSRPEWLDQASVGTLSQVSRIAGTRVVTVVDDGALAARRVPLLYDLEPGLQLQVPLLSFDETFRMAIERLGGAVEAETVARIRAESGGLYGVAVAMLDVGRRSGALVRVDGLWKVEREFADDHIANHIAHLLAGVTPSQLRVMQAIAAANLEGSEFTPVPQSLDDLAELMSAGLVREEAGRWELFPPLVEERMRHDTRRLPRGKLTGVAPDDQSGSPPPLLAGGVARRGTPHTPPSLEAEAVAGQRLRRTNRAKALRLRAVWERTLTARDALPLVVALQTSGADRGEIADVVARTTRPAPGSTPASAGAESDDAAEARPADTDATEYAVLTVWWAIFRELLLDESGAALAELRRARDEFPQFSPLFTAAITHIEMMLGGAAPDVARIADNVELDLGLGRVARVDAMLFSGATADALALASETEGVRPVFAAQLAISGNLARTLDGDVEGGLSESLDALERAEIAGNLGLMQAHAYAVMLGLVLRGRLRDAREFLDRVLAISTARALHTPYQRAAIDMGILIETLSVNPGAVQRLTDIASAFPRTAVPLPAMDAFATETASAVGGASDQLLKVVADRVSRGHLFSAAFLMMAARQVPPDRAVVDALRARTAPCQSPLLRTIGDYAGAVADGDAAAVLTFANDFHRMGAEVFSVAARGNAAGLYYDSGQKAPALALAQETWEISDALGDGRIGLLRPLSERIGLTEREVEAVLLGSHASNKAIADTLGLSQRTVENRWYAAYAKVGTSNRAELTRACETWLRAASSDE